MRLPKEVINALKTKEWDLIYWSHLLTFFQKHKSKLSLKQKIRFYKRSEEFRAYYNTERFSEHELVGNLDQIITIRKMHPPLEIEISDVYPNDLYSDRQLQDYLNNNTYSKLDQIKDTLTSWMEELTSRVLGY